jgi:hypothetical protein
VPAFDASLHLGPYCALLAAFTFKHFVADFVLQTTWMARGKERAAGWLAPLAAHVGCHGIATLAIALVVAPSLWWLAVAEVAIHGAIDRAKTVTTRAAGLTIAVPAFWWLLGFDQFLHQITNIVLATALALA